MMKEPLAAVGIGTVELLTKRTPDSTEQESHGILRLKNVLHTPSCLCNIIGAPIGTDYSLMVGGNDGVLKGWIKDMEDKPVAYFDATRPLFQVKLLDPPVGLRVGPHALSTGGVFMINIHWSDSERAKWEAYKARATNIAVVRDYTELEKAWLKENYRDEFHFLRDQGLSIYKEEDREEGRLIMRALAAQSDEE